MSQVQENGFKDSESLTKWTKWFLYAEIVIAVVSIISNILEYKLFLDFKNGAYISRELAIAASEANDIRQGVVGIAYLIILVISMILILRWIYRANYNARQLGASQMIFTPGWSIGWYFIPIVNLWKPYQAMKEIWKASANPQSWPSEPVSSILPWWWFLWIASNILGNASLRLTMRAEELNDFFVMNIVNQLSEFINILLSIIMIFIIKRVYAMQISHAKMGQSI